MKNNYIAYSVILTIAVLLKCGNCKDNKHNYTIAALLPILEENSNYLVTREQECSEKIRDDGPQMVEALYYALDLVQKDKNISQNFSMDIEVLETCGNNMANIRYFSKLFREAIQNVTTKEDDSSRLVGIIYSNDKGPFDYERLFKSMNLTQISISGPSPSSFNVDEVESYHTLHTTSGHFFILDVIFEILAYHNWKHVKLVGPNNAIGYDYQKSSFVRRAYELAESHKICISHTVSSDQLRTFGIYGSELLRFELLEADVVDVIICFCDANEIMSLKAELEKFNKTNRPGKVVIIAGSTDESWKDGKIQWEPKLGDLYYVTTKTDHYVKEFHDYYTSLTEENSIKHLYLKDFRQRALKFFNSADKSFKKSKDGDKFRRPYKNSSRIMRIMKSVYAMAHYLKDLYRFSKKGYTEKRNERFYEHLMKYDVYLQFPKFTLFGEETSYNLKNFPSTEKFPVYKYEATDNVTFHHNFIEIAEYLKYNDTETKLFKKSETFRIQGNLTVFDETKFQYSKYRVKSECSDPCPAGHRKELKRDHCCWECVPCRDFTLPNNDGTSCEKCKDGFVPNQYRNDCIPVIIQLPKTLDDGQNLISLGISSLTILLTAIVSCVFVKYQNTPAVKSTTKELCYIMFGGIILANTAIFISALTLSFETSNFKTLPAIGLAMVYGALAVKTNRIARLLVLPKDRFPSMKLKYVSVNAQITITCILVGIEMLICWLSVQTKHLIPVVDANDLLLIKYYLHGVFFVEIFCFVGLLVLFCTYYAIKTRNVPENFNETKYIGFAMYATVLTVVAFSLVYFASNKKIFATYLCISINSLTILIFMFSHKLYIILWTPERNIRVNFALTSSSFGNYIEKNRRPSLTDTTPMTTTIDLDEPAAPIPTPKS